MKVVRVICLVLVSLLAISPLNAVLAQEESSSLSFTPMGERYDTIAVVGVDKYLPLVIENAGTAAINNITFSSKQPEGWKIAFSPEKVDSLGAKDSKTIEVIIKIPKGADAGDYMTSFTASAGQVSKKIDIRVTARAPEPEVEVSPIYPRLEAIAGGEFVFEVEFLYSAGTLTDEAVDFNLRTTAPKDWTVYLTPPYEKDKKVSAIRLKPTFTPGNKLRFVASAPFWPLPDPGDYKIGLEVVSDDGKLKDSLELTAVITAKYFLAMVPTTERYNTSAKSGKENLFSIEVVNLGTAAIDNIKLSSDNPQGWRIEFTPDKIESLGALDSQTVDINIKPPAEAIAGDYSITLKASGEQTSASDIQIRVTVESPTVWGWVGIGIILLVLAGLIVIFMRFSRR